MNLSINSKRFGCVNFTPETCEIINIFSPKERYLDIKNSVTLYENILSLRFDYLFIWDGPLFFANLDTFAIKNNLHIYKKLEDKGRRILEPTLSILDGEGINYQRKLWLKTPNKLTGDRHKRISSTCFINFSVLFGGMKFEEAREAFGIDRFYPDLLKLKQLVLYFNDYIESITGIPYITGKGIKHLTMGSFSKDYYLKLRYPTATKPLKCYQNDHIVLREIEDKLRVSRLLPGGLCYIKDFECHEEVFKYDINSLFPFIERDLPELTPPVKCTFSDFLKSPEGIIIIKSLTLSLKPGMIPLPVNHTLIYHGVNKNSLIIDGPISFFKSYYDIILKFYNVDDIEIEECYKMEYREQRDMAIIKYVDTLYEKKAKYNQYDGQRTIIKFLLNNLHGKFAQLPIQGEYDYILNNDGILTKTNLKTYDNWNYAHFDYIRGAYIYSRARAHMFNIIYSLCMQIPDFSAHLFYVDTDCIITDIDLVKYMPISPVDLGQFKYEKYYRKFKVFAPKVYAGNDNFGFNLVAAGIDKNQVINYILDNHPGVKTSENVNKIIWETLEDKNILYPVRILQRTAEGAEYKIIKRPLIAVEPAENEISIPWLVR